MRTRINDRLEQATRFPVTLIVAPAGFGKSVALRDFLESRKIDAVRYDVRREDGTLLAFVRRLSEALEPVAPSALAAFPAMQERVLAAEEPVRQLSDWLAEHLKTVRCTIAVDDLHFAAVDAASIALLADVIERTGDRIKWIIAARSDVGLPVATWLAYGRMDLPVGEDDLRFTTEEALAIADQAQAKIDFSEVEALRHLTEGWPVALAIALRTRTHSADLRTASFGTREMVYRYLAEQVFSALNAQQRAFALASCVFPSFDRGIAKELGVTPEFLDQFRAKLAFLSEDSGGSFRYHDLFRDFLEMELRRCGESEWTDAVCRAAHMLEERGDLTEALNLYGKARASKDILRIVEGNGFSLFERGHGEPLSAALAAVPEPERRKNATALGLRAMLDAGRGHFEIAEPEFLAAIEAARDSALRFVLVHRYAIELVRNGRDCVDLLRPYALDDALAPALRLPLLGTLATAYVRTGHLQLATQTMDSALRLIERGADDYVHARVFQQAAYVYENAGSADKAEHYARMAVDVALEHNLYEVAARAYSVLYNLRYDNDDAVGSLRMLEKLGECARKGASSQTELYGLIASYDLEAEMGNELGLEQLDAALAEIPTSLPVTRAEALVPALALRAAWGADFARAYELVASTAEKQSGGERRALRAAETALYAMAGGMQQEAAVCIAEAERYLEDGVVTRRTIRARILLALAHLMSGHSANAHRMLTGAEQSIKPNMRRLRALCHAARTAYRVQLQQAQRSELDDAIRRLRDEQFGGMARLFAVLPLAEGERTAFSALTPAEREILGLLVRGASTKDVANDTGRSPHTVDTHIRSLCRKLGCSGRREAVALATSQGWVHS